MNEDSNRNSHAEEDSLEEEANILHQDIVSNFLKTECDVLITEGNEELLISYDSFERSMGKDVDCKIMTNGISSFGEHMKKKVRISRKCKICGKILCDKTALSRHLTLHSGERPFSCDKCKKAFTLKRTLEKHKRTHLKESERSYRCTICDKGFYDRAMLTRHLRVHSGEKPFSCIICGKSFSESGSLVRHHRTHTGVKPHHCKVCGYSFADSAALSQHNRVHSGERPFKCDTCLKTFSQRSTLSQHRKIHTAEKTFICKICSKAFSTVHSLKRHEKIHSITPTNSKKSQSVNLKDDIRPILESMCD